MSFESEKKSSLEEELEGLLGPLKNLISPANNDVAVTLTKRPTIEGDVDRIINQCIHGLLSKAELTSNELILLDALMKGRR